MFKISRITLIITLILIFIIAGVYLLFFPFIHLNYVIYQNKSGTQNSSAVITKFDLFKPKISQVIKLGDGSYWVSVSDFEREGIFTLKDTGFNDGVKKPIDFGAIDAKIENKSFEEVKKLAQDNDLSKVNPDPKNITGRGVPQFSGDEKEYRQKLEEAKKPENRYYDRLKLEVQKEPNRFPNYVEGRTIDDFKNLKKDLSMKEIKEYVGFGETSMFKGQISELPEVHFLINKGQVNFVALIYDNFGEIKNPKKLEAKLQKIVIVKQDRTFVEIPTKPDGTFDFEVVKNQWE